jgi:hypothetical protein
MKTIMIRKMFTWALAFAGLGVNLWANAGPGYMGFLLNGPTGTQVTTGEAASYMRQGSDWDGTAAHVVNNIAVPTVAQMSKVSTWRDAANLHFKFEIPDQTTQKPDGTSLACGDQIIVQIGPANTADTTLQVGKEFRFQVAIQNNQISGGVLLFKPNPIGNWKGSPEATTTATASLTVANQTYTVELHIPFTEIGNPNPANNFGVALAILNDLGHNHGAAPVVNEATGTTFPIGMGLLPASDPVFSCGVPNAPTPETASGNWKNPSTWGTGYTDLAAVAGDVTLDQGPQYSLSRAIRIGRCSVLNFNDIAEVSLANWESIQQNVANNWYKFNSDGPCRMTIWIDAKVAGAGVVKKRFMAVWGRPGIAPQEWFFAGLTEPVAISTPHTPVTLIWNKPTPVNFTGHPCLIVYVLPETLTAQQIADIKAIDTQSKLVSVVNSLVVPQGAEKSAQMNFSNLAPGTVCTENACMPLSSMDGGKFDLAQLSFINTANAQSWGEQTGKEWQPIDKSIKDDRGEGKRTGLIRVIAHGFGIAEPQGNKPYSYVETIGEVGWAIPSNLYETKPLTLVFERANPANTETMFVNGNVINIPSPPREILIALTTDVPQGIPQPKLDTAVLAVYAKTPMQPGQVATTQIDIQPTNPVIADDLSWWQWLLLILLILATLFVLWRKR